MQCHELAERIAEIDPELSPVEVARLCLLIFNSPRPLRHAEHESTIKAHWKAASFRLKAAADQYEAMTAELDSLCGDGPQQFDPEQIWTLVRAIKVQSQILDLYIDQPSLA